jgi:hypothetical protein
MVSNYISLTSSREYFRRTGMGKLFIKLHYPIIGGLNYVPVGTRPDITYAVNFLARFSSRPLTIHWKELQHLIGYLAGTKEQVLHIQHNKSK